jgi:hypothetical protein
MKRTFVCCVIFLSLLAPPDIALKCSDHDDVYVTTDGRVVVGCDVVGQPVTTGLNSYLNENGEKVPGFWHASKLYIITPCGIKRYDMPLNKEDECFYFTLLQWVMKHDKRKDFSFLVASPQLSPRHSPKHADSPKSGKTFASSKHLFDSLLPSSHEVHEATPFPSSLPSPKNNSPPLSPSARDGVFKDGSVIPSSAKECTPAVPISPRRNALTN